MNFDHARFEAQPAGGLAIWDVSHLLPRHRTRRYTGRDSRSVHFTMVHHSGRLGRPGYAGAEASASYVVGRRDFPGAAYHLWIPHAPLKDPEDRLTILRLNLESTRCWHSGGQANDGRGLVLQGNTSTDGISEAQIECLEGLLPYLNATSPETLGWHAVADRFGGHPKPSCPGRGAVRWLSEYLERAAG